MRRTENWFTTCEGGIGGRKKEGIGQNLKLQIDTQPGLRRKPRYLARRGYIQRLTLCHPYLSSCSIFRFCFLLSDSLSSRLLTGGSKDGHQQCEADLSARSVTPGARVLPLPSSHKPASEQQSGRGHYLGVVTCWIPDIGWGQPCSSHLEVSKSYLPGSWCRASKSLGIS